MSSNSNTIKCVGSACSKLRDLSLTVDLKQCHLSPKYLHMGEKGSHNCGNILCLLVDIWNFTSVNFIILA